MTTNTHTSPDTLDVDLNSYIVIEFDYDLKYIMPMDEGIQLLRCIANSYRWHDTYSNKTLTRSSKNIKISFMSERDIGRLKLELAVENKGDD